MGKIKIPTFLGVVLVLLMVVGLFVTTQDVDKITNLLSFAEENIPPEDVTVANVTDSSFTVFWTTKIPAEGTVFYGENENLEDGAAVDERALGATGGKYTNHLVKISGLSSDTNYFFKIGQSAPMSQIFEAKTGPKLSASTLEPLTGKALGATGAPLADAIASWQAPGASKVAVLTKSDGSYSLPIALARTTNLDGPYEPVAGSPEKIVIISGSEEGTINCQSGELSVMPDVKLGQTLDCTQGGSATKEQGGFGSLVKNPTSKSSSSDSIKLNIESGETVSTGLPTFSGKVGPKQVIKIVVHSEEVFSATVIAKPDGSWSWAPPSNLSPGEHTVTMTIVNADGTTQTVNRTFFVSSGAPLLPLTNGTPSGTQAVTPPPQSTIDGELLQSGIEEPTILALTLGIVFIILSAGVIYGSN